MKSTPRSLCVLVCLGVAGLAVVAPAADQPPIPTKTYDVIVYGGTPAGIIAAIAAAREGASVLLIEPSRHIGGMITGGLSRTDVGRSDVIGGLALEFFERVSSFYGDPAKQNGREKFYSEPHVAERVFNDMLREAGVTLITEERLDRKRGVDMSGSRIISISTESGRSFAAKIFIDATYVGDLMAASGVSYLVGRESREKYGEPLAGYHPMPIRTRTIEVMTSKTRSLGGTGPGYIHGTPTAISALNDKGRPIFGVERAPAGLEPGDADGRTQSYCYRLIVTRDPKNKIPFPKPENYSPARYQLLLRLVKTFPEIHFSRIVHLGSVRNNKFDLNAQGLFSTDYPGGNTEYPDGDYATRERIRQDHRDFTQGMLWFLGHDERLPKRLRDETNAWGLCRDEFTDNNHWPYKLYIREARRMIGEYVLTQKDLQREVTKPDSVAMGSFVIDCHIVRRIVTDEGTVTDEGSFQDAPVLPYEIPYRCLTPQRAECENLLVPVCISASHVGYCSVRMEPQYMMLGHAAGLAAAAAAREALAVQAIDIQTLQTNLIAQGAVLEFGTPGPSLEDLAGVVANDTAAKLTGTWKLGSSGPAVNGFYRHDGNTAKGEKSARYELSVPADGDYEVRLSYANFPNRATNVPVTIKHAGGTKTLRVNQRQPPSSDKYWISLGEYPFTKRRSAVITIGTQETDGYVAIDAVQLLPVK